MAMAFEEVQPIEGKRWCFRVHSRSRPELFHEVDLEAYTWNGACACENFMFAHAPELERGAKASDDMRCYHIITARSYVMEYVFPKLALAMGGPKMATAGEGESAATRAKQAIKSIRDVSLLMELRQLITGQIDEVVGRDYENASNPKQSAEPRRSAQKVYHLKG